MINKKMNKKILIIIIAVVLIVALGVDVYIYLNKKSKAKAEIKTLETAGKTVETITESATKGVLPSIQTNLFENKPDINPADKANPFKNIKTNPFE